MRYVLGSCSVSLLALGLMAMPSAQLLKAQEGNQGQANNAAAAESQPQEEAQKYWIGLQLMPVPEILRDHVETLQEGAATVAGVAHESPASKAGFEQGDHILKVGDKRVTSPQELVEHIQGNQGEKVKMEVLRGTKKQTLEVTPEEAPEAARTAPRERLGQGQRFRFFGPGQMMPPNTRLQMMAEDLPQNVTIRVEQKGDEPAQIHIERDGETWNVTEDEIDKLPEDLQKLAKQYVNQSDNGNTIISGREVPFSQMLRMFGAEGEAMPLPREELPDFREMQEQMRRDMQEVREMMKELRQRMEDQQLPREPKLQENEV